MKSMTVVFFSLFILNNSQGIEDQSQPIVTTALGQIRGSRMKSFYGREIAAFRGIPYAKPPIGDLRFHDPEPVEPWNDILDATQDGHICIQYEVVIGKVQGEEDCLILNIYSPDVHSRKPLPVMVWIHGGAFILGSSHSRRTIYGPRYLLDRDIVLVTFNYRLGPFGFLSTEDSEAPGNYGLMDQSLLLKWIQAHIHNFGGDPTSITLFGESAGGASVHYHLLSPHSHGLFHRAIIQSGASLCSWACLNTVGFYTKLMAGHLNCPKSPSNELVSCLRNKNATDIAEIRPLFEKFTMFPMGFGPRVDTERENPFLPEQPLTLMKRGQFSNVSVILGLNQDEGSFLSAMVLLNNSFRANRFQAKLDEYFSYILGIEFWENATSISNKAINKYLKRRVPLLKQISELQELLGDNTITICVGDTIDIHYKVALKPTYVYWYNYSGQLKLQHIIGIPPELDLGIGHGDELLMILGNDRTPKLSSKEDVNMSKVMVDLWSNFAIYGKPASEGIIWEPANKEKFKFLHLNRQPEMVEGPLPFEPRKEFWHSLFSGKPKDEL